MEKKIYTKLKGLMLMAVFALTYAIGQAQCPDVNTYFTDLTPGGVGLSDQTTVVYGGEYCTASVCLGAQYTFSTAGSSYDTQITLYNDVTGAYLGYNDDTPAGSSQAVLTWTATFSGTVRILVNEWDCLSNSTFTTLTVTQNTSCASSCAASNLIVADNGCYDSGSGLGFLPSMNTTYYFSGACTVATLWLSENGGTYFPIDLTSLVVTSGETVLITDLTEYSDYSMYFQLSNGATSGVYYFSTGSCSGCTVSYLDLIDAGCQDTGTGLGLRPSVDATVGILGGCYVSGVYISANGGAYQYLDVSALGWYDGYTLTLTNLLPNSSYAYYLVLSDGNYSSTYYYTTGSCVTCTPTAMTASDAGCVDAGAGLLPSMTTAYYFTGACTATTLYLSTDFGSTYTPIDLSSYALASGDPIDIINLVPNTMYYMYFELSNGAISTVYSYTTGSCITGCSNLTISYVDSGCYQTTTGTNVPSGDIYAFYNGSCTVEGVYSSVNGGAYQYLDLSAYGYTSGSAMGLLFNNQNTFYQVYYLLSDGSTSPITSFTTGACESGLTICDCAGTQVPIEATSWLGDGFLDQGASYWNGTIPVDFNCATWGFDCGDQIAAGQIPYDPYGVCSGALPPANGCVDEFCYNIDLDVFADCYPTEISLMVYNSNNDLVFIADGATYMTAGVLNTFNLCLPAGCYTFTITDTYGDGMYNSLCGTNGYFGVYDYSTSAYEVFVNGDGYSSSFSQVYCVGPQTTCSNLEMSVSTAPCFSSGGAALLPSIFMDFSYSGPCLVESVYLSANGGTFNLIDVSAEGWGSGDVGQLINLVPNTDYQIYFVTNDGAVSYLYNFTTSDCNNEITICDCSGTQHSIGVTAWLGDGFADNGTYQWAGQYVNLNCATWGYDCGDVAGAPSIDPYGVCNGGLPPFNGCINTQEVLGCTDPTAVNYNPAATINDGSCIYNVLEGCTDMDACNYNDQAVLDNGTCEYVTCAGCTDPTATNYDETATIDDGSCSYQQIPGCMDPAALNYNPTATIGDGSCVYSCVWPTVYYEAHCNQGDLDNFYVDVELFALGNGAPYTISNSYNQQQLVLNLSGSFTMGPFPNDQQVVIYVTSFIQECSLTSPVQVSDCSAGGVYGCDDPDALNYNPNVTVNDGSCIYLSGCTDPTALNYNANAVIDDGSCVYTGIVEVSSGRFNVYPNPARDQFYISNEGEAGVQVVKIIDATGRIVSSEQVVIGKGSQRSFDVSHLASGNYHIEIVSAQGSEHHMLVVQH